MTPTAGKDFICTVSRTKCPKTQSDAKSWLGCADWISILQKQTDFCNSMTLHASISWIGIFFNPYLRIILEDRDVLVLISPLVRKAFYARVQHFFHHTSTGNCHLKLGYMVIIDARK